jgi:hypothetical protein
MITRKEAENVVALYNDIEECENGLRYLRENKNTKALLTVYSGDDEGECVNIDGHFAKLAIEQHLKSCKDLLKETAK